jgi:hypothetical protein
VAGLIAPLETAFKPFGGAGEKKLVALIFPPVAQVAPATSQGNVLFER